MRGGSNMATGTLKRVLGIGLAHLGGLIPVGSAAEAQEGIGVGMGMDVEYVAPQRFRDPGDKTRVWFPVKFVCGETGTGDVLAPGSYGTLINVINLSKFKTHIGWWFSAGSGPAGFAGAQAEIQSHGTLVMDCDFILRNLQANGVDVGSFTEGFVSIEDLNTADMGEMPTRVTVVYSSLHKQIHGLPDLIPRETKPNYCERDDQGRLIVTIRNQGEAAAPASTTRVVINNRETVERATPPLAVGQEAALEPIPMPPAGEGTLPFTIMADVTESVSEMNEPNNKAYGGCLIIN